MPVTDPTPRRALRLQLGLLLRRHREAAGLAQREAYEALDWYPAKVSKLESGGVTISRAEVDRLAELYGVTGADLERLRALNREARRRGVVTPERDFARTFLDLEQAADEVLALYSELLPGPVQTEDYARALLHSGSAGFDDARIDTIAASRAARLRRFRGEGTARLWVVLGEAALHRPVGGPDAHRAQLRHLRELVDEPRITLQVLPFAAGEHGALGTDFFVLRMLDPAFALVYVPAVTDGLYHEAAPHTDVYSTLFTKAQVAALGERESGRMLDARLRDLA